MVNQHEWYLFGELVSLISVSAKAEINQPRVLVSALYGADNIVKEVRIGTSSYFGDNYIRLSVSHRDVNEGDYVRAFLWTDFASMNPIAP